MECITLLRLFHPIVLKEIDEETNKIVKMIDDGIHDRM